MTKDLTFNINSNCSTSELLPELRKLAKYLGKLEQDEVDLSTLTPIAHDITGHGLLKHKDKGIKVLVACCIADLLRIYAPQAPFSNAKLHAIFEFLLKQLELVGDTSGPFYAQAIYLLETISQVKSILILWDLDADDLVHRVFELAFNTLSPAHSKNVMLYYSEMLRSLITESTSLPTATVQLIIQQLGPKAQHQNSAAFRLAVLVASQSVDKLQRYACQYFSDLIVAASKGAATEEHESDLEDYESDSAQNSVEGGEMRKSLAPRGTTELAKTAHKLIVKIHESVPGLLLNVVPQLEEELKVDHVGLRLLATTTLGEMFLNEQSQLAAAYPSTWTAWLERRNDKSLQVRLAWIDCAAGASSLKPSLWTEVEEALGLKLLDPDEQVRAHVIKTLHIDMRAYSVEFLKKIGERCRDKKHVVRSAAAQFLGKWFNASVGESGLGTCAPERHSWIPGCILTSIQFEDAGVRALVEKVLFTLIIPSTLSDKSRAERFCYVLQLLEKPVARICLKTVFARQLTAVEDIKQYVKICEMFQPGATLPADDLSRSLLDRICAFIAKKLPDTRRCELALAKLALSGDKIIRKLFLKLCDPLSEHETVLRIGRDLMRRCEVYFHASESLPALVRRLSPSILNQSTVTELVKLVNSAERAEALHFVNELYPELYRDSMDVLFDLGKSYPVAWEGIALAIRADSTLAIPRASVESAMTYVCRPGYGAVVGKLVAVIPGPDGSDLAAELADGLLDNLQVDSNQKLAAICEIARFNLLALEDAGSDRLTRLLLSEIILSPIFLKPDTQDTRQAACLAVTILVARLVSLNSLDVSAERKAEMIDAMAAAVFRLVFTLIEYDGNLFESPLGQRYVSDSEFVLSSSAAAELRLTAGIGGIELAVTLPERISVAQGEMLGCLLQDPEISVRTAFLENLCASLLTVKLPSNYAALLVLSAHEPDASLLQKAKNCFAQVVATVSKKSATVDGARNEQSLALLLFCAMHMLAVSPDFGSELAEMQPFIVYLEFLLDTVLNVDNASFVYYIATLLKTVRCVEDDSTNLYMLSEALQVLIQQRCKASGWSLPTWPGNIQIPSILFSKLPSAQERLVVKTFYLPSEVVESLKSMHHHHQHHGSHASDGSASKLKRTSKNSKPEVAKKLKRTL